MMTLPHLLSQATHAARISDVSSMNNKNSSATNGFQPAVIPTSNVRAPPGHKEKVASISTNGKILISSLLASPKSPIAPLPRTNAQARTARKSAFVSPSSSRGDGGYSTSSSGNSGRKSLSGLISGGDKRERDSLSMSEVSSDSPVRIQAKNQLENHRHAQKRLPPPKSQQVQQTQQPTTLNEDSSPTMPAAASSAASASNAAAAPAGAIASKTSSTKRPPLALPETISSTKPKRQKTATAKAAALAKEPYMNADGTAIKKRRPPGELSAKEKARERKRAKAIKGSGMFSLKETIEPITGATINVAAKPQPASAHPPRPRPKRPVVPTLPPPYEVPMGRYLERQPATKQQQETNGSPILPAVIPHTELLCRPIFQPAKLPTSSKTNVKTPNNSSSSRTQHKVQGNSVREAILIDSSPSSVETKKDNPLSLQNVKRKGLGKPPVYNIPSDSDDSAVNLRSPGSGQNLRCLQIKQPSNASSYDNAGALAVTHLLFMRCVSPHTSPEERKKLYLGIEDIIQRLEVQKDQSRAEEERSKTFRHPIRWSNDQGHITTEDIADRLRRLCVITDHGSIITFEQWEENTPEFKGRFILLEDAEDAQRSFDKISSELPPPDAFRPSGTSARLESCEVLVVDAPKDPTPRVQSVSGISSISRSPEDSRRASVVSDSNNTDYSVPDTQETAKTPGEVADGEPNITEGSIASDVVQLVGTLSSSLNVADPVLSEEYVTSQAVSQTEEHSLGIIEESQEEEDHEERMESPSLNADIPEEIIESSSPSDLVQEQDTAPTLSPPGSPKVGNQQPFVSNKRKKKTRGHISVEDFLSESIPDKVLQQHQASALLKGCRETDDIYSTRILRLEKEERSVKTELDALNASAKAREAEYKRRIEASIKNTGDEGVGRANWGQCGKLVRELRDIQEDYARETVRLVDKASRIVEERTWCLAQKKIMEENNVVAQANGPNDESTSSTTASASISDLIDEDSVSNLFRIPAEKDIEGYSMARELLRELIPWSKIQPDPSQSSSSVEQEAIAAAAAAAEAKKKIRKKKRYRW